MGRPPMQVMGGELATRRRKTWRRWTAAFLTGMLVLGISLVPSTQADAYEPFPLFSSISGGGTYAGRVVDGVTYPGGTVQVGISCILVLCLGSAKAITTKPVTGEFLQVGGGFFIGGLFTCPEGPLGTHSTFASSFYLGIHSQEPYIRTTLGGDFWSNGEFRLADSAGSAATMNRAAGTLTSGAFHQTAGACI